MQARIIPELPGVVSKAKALMPVAKISTRAPANPIGERIILRIVCLRDCLPWTAMVHSLGC
jgi:hypothetical protein